MTKWNLSEFQNFIHKTFSGLKRTLGRQQDGRDSSSNCIDASQIASSLFFQIVLGINSIHQLDQWLRQNIAGFLLNTNNSQPAGSDSTILQAADGWNIDDIRKSAHALIDQLSALGRLTFPHGGSKTIRPAILDGSCFGNHWFSVLTLCGKTVQAPLDLEPYSNMGKERSAGFRLLQRLKMSSQSLPFTHLLLDGLYMNTNIFLKGLEMGFDPLVKTTEKTLSCARQLQQDFDNYFNAESLPEHLSVIKGFDRERGFKFQALQNNCIAWHGFTLNGLQLEITYTSGHRKGKTATFWVFTTDTDLSAQQLRLLAHKRWAIENNEFKQLNELVGSKSAYIQSQKKKHAILFWQMVGLALFQAFKCHCQHLVEKMKCGHTMTKKFLIEKIKMETYRFMFAGKSPPTIL